MALIIALLTLILVLDCLFLVFLVLIQLPKKDAGAGLAFGGAATDALFGAGSGNVLTKVTKYAAGTFFVLAILLSFVYGHRSQSGFEQKLSQPGSMPARMPSSPITPAPAPTTPPTASQTAPPSIPATTTTTAPATTTPAPQAEQPAPAASATPPSTTTTPSAPPTALAKQ